MTKVPANGIEIEVEEAGPKDGPAVLLIAGLGLQLVFWPEAFVSALADAGYRVIRFDNRDAGLSTKMDGVRPPKLRRQILKRLVGLPGGAPYTVDDMAADAAGVLDALGVDRAHVVGLSMGGIIAQVLAATRPDRVASLTLMMTTTNNPRLPRPKGEAARVLFERPPANPTREEAIERGLAVWLAIGTKDAEPADAIRARVARDIDRAHETEGTARQLAAIIETSDVRRRTRTIRAPALVVHGTADPLVSPRGGEDIAANLPGARLERIEGMGHDLPPKHLERVTALVLEHLRAADASAEPERVGA